MITPYDFHFFQPGRVGYFRRPKSGIALFNQVPLAGKRGLQVQGDKQPIKFHDQLREGHVKQRMPGKQRNSGVHFGKDAFFFKDEVCVVTDDPTDISKDLIVRLDHLRQISESGKIKPLICASSPEIDDRQQAGKADEQEKNRLGDDILVCKHFSLQDRSRYGIRSSPRLYSKDVLSF